MLKRWNQFIREFIENSENIIDSKMQELKDIIDNVSDENLIYEWENKDDHELLVNFTTGNLSIRYEFDIDGLFVVKVVGDTVDFTKNVKSISDGLDIIEKDIRLVLGVNELFDTEDLKSQYEIPYLTGEMSPSNINKWSPVKTPTELGLDKLLVGLLENCPYLIELMYRRNGRILELGFSDTINYDPKNQVFYHFSMEIVEYSNGTYGLNIYAKCIGNGQTIYNESMIKKADNFGELVNLIKRPVFNMLVEFNNYLTKIFDKSHFSVSDKGVVMFNPRMN